MKLLGKLIKTESVAKLVDEFSPFCTRTVKIKHVDFWRREKIFIELIFLDNWGSAKYQPSLFCKFFCLGFDVRKVKSLSEILVFLRLADIDFVEINVCSMIEYHANAPPFFLHTIIKSSTVSSIDCKCKVL